MKIIDIKQYGFNPDLVKIKPEDYVFGSALPYIIIKEDGQYDDFLPVYEPQADKYETSGCTVWGGQNQIETYFKKVFGFEPNYAEIFNYVLVGIRPPGANPQDAYQSFKNDGLVDNELLPIPDTYEKFIDTKQITEELKAKGKEWLERYDFKHEWLINPTKEQIVNALPCSPIAIAVTAWIEEDELYIDNGRPNTHWCLCYGYIKDERGIRLKIFDSYDHSKKLLHPDHKTSVAKRILIKKKEIESDTVLKIKDTEIIKDTDKRQNWFIEIMANLLSFLLDIIKIIFNRIGHKK